MCYGEPDRLLELVMGKRELPKNDLGHTPLEDFEHFCSYSGCSEQEIGPRAFAFVRLAYVTAGLNPRRYRTPGLGVVLEKDCENVGMLLRDRPPGTTADISDDTVLYWDAGKLHGASLSAEESEVVAMPLELEDALPGMEGALANWLARPKFTFRPSLLEWLDGTPVRKSTS
ncbi:hypothetical protein [Paraburkholderia xenovorans]